MTALCPVSRTCNHHNMQNPSTRTYTVSIQRCSIDNDAFRWTVSSSDGEHVEQSHFSYFLRNGAQIAGDYRARQLRKQGGVNMSPAEEHVLEVMRKLVGPEGRPGVWYIVNLDEVRTRLTEMREEPFQSCLLVLAEGDFYRRVDDARGHVKF
jgi:hypothetical protein